MHYAPLLEVNVLVFYIWIYRVAKWDDLFWTSSQLSASTNFKELVKSLQNIAKIQEREHQTH